MNVVNFSDARNNLEDVIDRVVQGADVIVITRPDGPDAVLMSLHHYNSLLETVHLLSSPANAAHLAHSLAQLRAGEEQAHDVIDAEKATAVHDGPDADIH
jgi:antitoxin YefM